MTIDGGLSGRIRVESTGSFWVLDFDLERYMRCPKGEQPREHPEWGDASAGALQDWVWHPLTTAGMSSEDPFRRHLTLVTGYPSVTYEGQYKKLMAPLDEPEVKRLQLLGFAEINEFDAFPIEED